MQRKASVLLLMALLGCGSSGGGSSGSGGQGGGGSGGAAPPLTDSGSSPDNAAGQDAPPADGPLGADGPAAGDLPAGAPADTGAGDHPETAPADGGGTDGGGLPAGLKAIMITNPPPNMPSPGDVVMRDRLRALGFAVTLVSDAAVTTQQAAAQDLVVISSSAESAPLGTKVRDVTIPVVSIENGEYPIMRMTGTVRGTDFDMTAGQTSIDIKMPGHALAAGLTGTVKVSSMAGDLGWGVPGPNAIVIASVANTAGHAALFAYDKGVMMVGMAAPARRVGYAIREALAANLTATASSCSTPP